jgi:hypothetical protein
MVFPVSLQWAKTSPIKVVLKLEKINNYGYFLNFVFILFPYRHLLDDGSFLPKKA